MVGSPGELERRDEDLCRFLRPQVGQASDSRLADAEDLDGPDPSSSTSVLKGVLYQDAYFRMVRTGWEHGRRISTAVPGRSLGLPGG